MKSDDHCICYIIKPRDTLYKIAKEYGSTVERLLFDNPGIDPYNLQIGSTILVCRDCDGIFPMPPIGAAPPPEGVMPVVPPISPPVIPAPPIGAVPPAPGPPIAPMPPPYTPLPPIGAVPPDCADLFKWLVLFGAMRNVWLDHVYWTRLLLVSIAHKLPDEAATTTRLLQNPADIAAVYANFYPPAVTEQITRLLTEHLQIGAQLITALRDNKKAEADELSRRWYANADEMAAAFAGINPNYDLAEMRSMFRMHLDKTTEEVAARLRGDYPADIAAFEDVKTQALEMADYLSAGLADMIN